jgi:NAD(P)-dependent dehydrogenase (short-subunit alcohol dehydrogenase family)
VDAAHPRNHAGKRREIIRSNTLFKRPAQPVEQAAVFAFLASDDASYITGEIYGATGGKMPL